MDGEDGWDEPSGLDSQPSISNDRALSDQFVVIFAVRDAT
jgi:hypothetical protein